MTEKVRTPYPKANKRAIVAPWTSLLADKAQYLTDGIADDIEINAAIEWARVVEDGEVLLIHGTYVIEDPIMLADFTIENHSLGYLFTRLSPTSTRKEP